MKSHMLLLRVVLDEMGTRCCTSTRHDWKTIASRVEHEGLSFLTITLPAFCTDFEKSLSKGMVDQADFVGYSKSGYLPKFLSGFTDRVFCTVSGLLVDEPDIEAIQAIRQITLLYSRLNLPCSDARVKAAIKGYVDCEQQVRDHDAVLDSGSKEYFLDMTMRVWGNLLNDVNRSVYKGEVVPKHGPGTTADRMFGNQKYNQHVWTERLEDMFPAGDFIFPSWSHFLDSPDTHWLDPGSEIPVKVITVPKTLKTPRIIAIEPTCMQYTQQALMECIVQAIERDDILSSLIGFDDQVPNQDMARIGSLNGSLATLDLKEASDRVSNQLVRLFLLRFPWLSRGVDACRSRKADVPGVGVIRLAKFASMGSALTFPIEAMVFLTVVLMGIESESSKPLSYESLTDFIGSVRIFGDDIVIPAENVRSVVGMLRTFGFQVNPKKSFWTGKFRESCGKEYYDGEDVSIVRATTMLPTQRRHVPEIISTVSLRNRMYFSGNWETVEFLDEHLGRIIPFPVVGPESPALGRHSFLGYTSERECPFTQRAQVRAYSVRAPLPLDHLEGAGALMKFFLKRSLEPSEDRDHLERAGRPKTVNIKLGWVPAF